MLVSRMAFASLIAITAAAFVVPHPSRAAHRSPTISSVDPDHDGKLSLAEAEAAAAKKFAAVDPDNDAIIDLKETKGALRAFVQSSDPDKDGKIDKAEYMALVEAAFKKADPDGDGDIDAKELKTPAGKILLGLIK